MKINKSNNEVINLTNEEIWIIRYAIKEIQNAEIKKTDQDENIININLLFKNEEIELMKNILTKINYK